MKVKKYIPINALIAVLSVILVFPSCYSILDDITAGDHTAYTYPNGFEKFTDYTNTKYGMHCLSNDSSSSRFTVYGANDKGFLSVIHDSVFLVKVFGASTPPIVDFNTQFCVDVNFLTEEGTTFEGHSLFIGINDVEKKINLHFQYVVKGTMAGSGLGAYCIGKTILIPNEYSNYSFTVSTKSL